MLVLEGEAGAGKSRLVAELVDQAVAAGVPVLDGAGDAVERNTPWHPWRELFGGLPPFDGADRAERRRLVLELLGPDPEDRDLAPLLNPVLGLELPETAASAELSGQGRAGRTRDLLVRLLRAAVGETPTVLVIEDAHWLDSASTGLVLALSREHLPLLLVVATRPPGRHRDAHRRPRLGRLPAAAAGARTWSCWCWTGSPPTRSGTWSASAWARPRSPTPWPGWSRARPRATRCSPRS